MTRLVRRGLTCVVAAVALASCSADGFPSGEKPADPMLSTSMGPADPMPSTYIGPTEAPPAALALRAWVLHTWDDRISVSLHSKGSSTCPFEIDKASYARGVLTLTQSPKPVRDVPLVCTTDRVPHVGSVPYVSGLNIRNGVAKVVVLTAEGDNWSVPLVYAIA